MRRIIAASFLIASSLAAAEKREHFEVVDLSGAVVYRMTVFVTLSRVDVLIADRSDFRYLYRWEERGGVYTQRVEALDCGQSLEGADIAAKARDANATRNFETRFVRLLQEMFGKPVDLTMRPAPPDCAFDESFGYRCED
jgi:hypothetical protein